MGFTRLNGVYSTVATQSNTASTSVVLGTGQGAAFASATTTNPVRCAVIDTSTSPETLKFFLDVTGVSTDTLTVANRGVTDGNVSSADANILVGYTIAAVLSVGALDGSYAQRANNGSDFADAGSTRQNLAVPTLAACRVVATGNITLSGTQTIDGVAVAAGDRVLAAGQTTSSQNGPWVVASGAWTRPTDYPAAGTLQGRVVQVMAGTVNAGSMWVLLTSATVTVDTTSTSWQTVNKVSGSVLASVTSKATQATVTSLSAVDLNPTIATPTFVADGSDVTIHWGCPAASNGTAGDGVALFLTRNDGTVIDYMEGWSATASARVPLGGAVSIDTPTAGVVTSYKLQAAVTTGGTMTFRNTSSLGQFKIIVRHA